MSQATNASNRTVNYELPLFVGTDRPSWLVDWNGAMAQIDDIIKGVSDAAEAGTAQLIPQVEGLDNLIEALGGQNSTGYVWNEKPYINYNHFSDVPEKTVLHTAANDCLVKLEIVYRFKQLSENVADPRFDIAVADASNNVINTIDIVGAFLKGVNEVGSDHRVSHTAYLKTGQKLILVKRSTLTDAECEMAMSLQPLVTE